MIKQAISKLPSRAGHPTISPSLGGSIISLKRKDINYWNRNTTTQSANWKSETIQSSKRMSMQQISLNLGISVANPLRPGRGENRASDCWRFPKKKTSFYHSTKISKTNVAWESPWKPERCATGFLLYDILHELLVLPSHLPKDPKGISWIPFLLVSNRRSSPEINPHISQPSTATAGGMCHWWYLHLFTLQERRMILQWRDAIHVGKLTIEGSSCWFPSDPAGEFLKASLAASTPVTKGRPTVPPRSPAPSCAHCAPWRQGWRHEP